MSNCRTKLAWILSWSTFQMLGLGLGNFDILKECEINIYTVKSLICKAGYLSISDCIKLFN